MATPDPDPDATAGELALGLLDGAERAAALRRMLADRDFARAVDRWRDHFGTLFAAWPGAAPPAGLFDRIENTLDARPAVTRAWAWQAATAAASLIAACLLVALLIRPAQPPVLTPVPMRPLVASLAPTAQGGGAPIAAVYDRASGTVRLAAAPLAPAGRSAQLWAIGGDGAPRPIGLLATAAPSDLRLPAALRPLVAAGLTLAISIEPRGGSPTGKPTGPVVALGTLIQA